MEALSAPAFGAGSNLAFVGEGGSVVFAESLALAATLSCSGRQIGVRGGVELLRNPRALRRRRRLE